MSLSFPDKEPVITASTVVALVAAIIALVVAFGVPLTTDQKEAVIATATVIAPFVVAALTRPQVTPNAKVDAQVMQVLGANGGNAPVPEAPKPV